jgi:hypothetical protein
MNIEPIQVPDFPLSDEAKTLLRNENTAVATAINAHNKLTGELAGLLEANVTTLTTKRRSKARELPEQIAEAARDVILAVRHRTETLQPLFHRDRAAAAAIAEAGPRTIAAELNKFLTDNRFGIRADFSEVRATALISHQDLKEALVQKDNSSHWSSDIPNYERELSKLEATIRRSMIAPVVAA